MKTDMLIIGGTILAVVVLVLYAIDRWGVFEDDEENTNTGTERIQREAANQQDFDISLFKKTRAYTLPVKIVGVSLGLLSLGVMGYAYLILRNGAPVEIPYANAMQMGVVVVVSLFVGVTVANRKHSSRGRLDVVYEDTGGDAASSETIYFDPSNNETNADGNIIVYEQFKHRIFGLWGKYRLVKHDRELRTTGKPLHDRVSYEIPDEAVEQGPNHWEIRTQGKKTNDAPSSAADYTFRPPDVLPHEVRVQRREEYNKMQTQNDSFRAQLAQAHGEIRTLRDDLRERERRDIDELISDVNRVQEALEPKNAEYTIRQDRTAQRHPESQREVSELSERGADAPGVSN